jgi:RNA polymerase sigma-70 factor (ECF subfamily)
LRALEQAPRSTFERLVRRYGRLVSRVVAKAARGQAKGAEADIEQRVMVGLWRQLSREQTVEHPSSYLYRAAVRETVRYLKEESRRGQVALDEAVEQAAPLPDPEQSLAAREQGRRLEAALERLLPERAVAVRAHLEGHEVQEIMKLHGWPYQKARNLIARGMADLREALGGRD